MSSKFKNSRFFIKYKLRYSSSTINNTWHMMEGTSVTIYNILYYAFVYYVLMLVICFYTFVETTSWVAYYWYFYLGPIIEIKVLCWILDLWFTCSLWHLCCVPCDIYVDRGVKSVKGSLDFASCGSEHCFDRVKTVHATELHVRSNS